MANKKRNKLIIPVILAVIIALCVGGYFGYSFISNDINGNQQYEGEYNLYVTDNMSQYDVSQRLYNNGIVISLSLIHI